MTSSGAADGEERLNRLYTSLRDQCIRYAARRILGNGSNRHILGVEAEEIFDEAMHLYYERNEHLNDLSDDEHERNIKHRIDQCVITWVRKKKAAKRTAPGPVDSLEAALDPDDPSARSEPPDPNATKPEQLVDLADHLGRLPLEDRTAAAAKARGDTYKEIAEDTGSAEETIRRRVRRAAESLQDDP